MREQPEAWLVNHRHLLPRSGAALDVACGRGRHAVWLAHHGFDVLAVDRDRQALDAVTMAAGKLGRRITVSALDLETDGVDLGAAVFDLVVGFNYLHRPLFPRLIASLKAGGVLVYETFTREQAACGKPTNPDYLLEQGELRRLAVPLTVLAAREGEDRGRFVASIVARKDRR